MKIKDGFILQDIAGDAVVLPTGADMDQNMMITLNDTGRFLWERLSEGATEETLVQALLGEYDVDAETAAAAVAKFVSELKKHDFLV